MMSVCIYCQSEVTNFKYPTEDIYHQKWDIHQCTHCSAFFISPLPTPQQLELAYNESYYGEDEGKKFSFPFIETTLDYFRNSRARKVKKYLKNGDSVLDIGCGNGGFLNSLNKFPNLNIFGSELDNRSAERASKHPNIQLIIGELKIDDFDDNSLDLITLFHVFEHLRNPKDTLQFIDKKIKKGGHIVMSFPNIESWQSKIFKGNWLHLDPPRHLFFFNASNIKQIMKNKGFQVVNESFFSIEQNPFGMVQSILNKLFKKRDLLFESMKGNKDYVKEYRGASILLQYLFFAISFPIFIITDFISSIFKKSATMELTFKKL